MSARRLAFAALLVAVLATLAWWTVRRGPVGTVAVRVGAPGDSRVASDGPAPSPQRTPAERALARAYAALGAATSDGGERLSSLDDEAKARLEEAGHLLERERIHARPASGAAGVPASASPSPAVTGPAIAVESGVGSAPAATAVANGDAAEAGMVLDLAHAPDPRQALHDGPEGPILVQPGLWARSTFHPERQARLRISDHSGGAYVIALYASDYSTIRLDGGLVVPGRYYRVDGDAVITGETACSVDIRPLEAVPAYAEKAVAPQGNG